jgi:thiamine biosynthesis lipoprotein
MTVKAFAYHWPHHSFHAMGTQIDAWIEAEPESADQALGQVETLFRDVEAALSRFNPASELSKLNAQSETWVPVSKTLWSVLTLALEYAEETEGVFDPALLGALRAAGYSESFERIGYGGPIEPAGAAARTGGWRAIRLDAERRRVWLPGDAELDFGGIAKGYTAGWAALLIGLWGPCLIDAGGDLAAGDAPAGLPGWPVTILAPRIEGRESTGALVSLTLANNSLATSGVDLRRWKIGGRAAHHLIDPRTAQPAESEAVTVSALAPTGAAAEVWAKLGLIKGAAGLAALSERNIPALIISRDHALHFNNAMWQRIHEVDTEVEVVVHSSEVPGQKQEPALLSSF